MKQILILLAVCLLVGCYSDNSSDKSNVLQGAWTLQQVEYPYDRPDTYYKPENTLLRLYDGDSVVYQCWLTKTESGFIIRPELRCPVTLVDKGHGEYVYIEEDNPRPLTIANDSMIVIQQQGVLYTFQRADDLGEEWGADIITIIAEDTKNGPSEEAQSYVLSAKERRQANVINNFILSTILAIILMLLIVRVTIQYRKDKQRLQLQLQQIQEVKQERPQSVRKAIESVEEAYFASNDYEVLQRRIATGQRLKDEDWQEIESHIRRVYPGFGSQLRNLYTMSELEYQVCLLIKLRMAPKDIAAVLARDMSTISTVRSRLYKKVFGKKGGAREWDEFILTMGA
jgi:uncharacterized membrane-anchored protein YhcB (DUF1043 family)